MTRINLDVPRGDAHRITLLTQVDGNGQTGLTRVDGSTYDPFAKRILVTMEGTGSTTGGMVHLPVDFAAGFQDPTTLYEIIGRGGYEGIHPDDQGSLTLAEDIGGAAVSADPTDPIPATKAAKAPSSFVYRFVPTDPTDLLSGGKLYALQVENGAGQPILFHGHGGRPGQRRQGRRRRQGRLGGAARARRSGPGATRSRCGCRARASSAWR